MIDVSIIITGYKEPRTISHAIRKALISCDKANLDDRAEIIIVAPDLETLSAAYSCQASRPEMSIKVIKDPGRGKPTALNLALQASLGQILILTDGDVFMSQYAIRELLEGFDSEKVGAVGGRPRSVNSKDNCYGYWSHLLTDMADVKRKETKGFVCSGYLYALRKGIVESIPEDCLSDDAYISYKVLEKGYEINYAPSAQVFVTYPDNFKDWINQKKRSAGGYVQLKEDYKLKPRKEMRSFFQELKDLWKVIEHPKTPSEVWWMIELLFARLYLWMNIFWERKVIKKDFNKTWVRIDSTK